MLPILETTWAHSSSRLQVSTVLIHYVLLTAVEEYLEPSDGENCSCLYRKAIFVFFIKCCRPSQVSRKMKGIIISQIIFWTFCCLWERRILNFIHRVTVKCGLRNGWQFLLAPCRFKTLPTTRNRSWSTPQQLARLRPAPAPPPGHHIV